MVFAGGGGITEMDPLKLTVQIVRGRWFMLFASFLIMSAAGATYLFGSYSHEIKTSLGYNQQTLNTISFFKDLGANVGVLSGLVNEVTPPWVVLFIGAVMNFGGYFMIYLAITERIARPKLWQVCTYICIGANSQSFANTGSLVTCKNFPESRGIVLGLLKGFLGLSGAIITQLYLAFYDDDSNSLVVLIAWLPAAISIVFLHTIRIMPVIRATNEVKVFYSFVYMSMALAGCLMVMIVVQKQLTFSHPEYSASAAVVLLLLFLPLVVVVKEEISLWRQRSLALSNNSLSITVDKTPPVSDPLPLTSPPAPQAVATSTNTSFNDNHEKKTMASRIIATFKSPKRGEDYTILQALVSIDMLTLFIANICGLGGTLTAIDNMGQIGESLGYPKKSINTFVSLISIWNYCGRVTAGFASEIFLAKYRLPRPMAFTFVLLLSCVGHLLIAFGVNGSLYVASVIIWFCFGAQWPLLFAIVSEIFGLKYLSTLCNLGAAASPVGSYRLNVRVAGHLYDVEVEKLKLRGITYKDTSGKRDLTSIGVQYFKLSFLIITAATFLGALVSMVLVWRTRKFYRSDIYAKFREAAAEAEMGLPAGMTNGQGEEDAPEKKRVSATTAE